jgi:hypothetical protein
MPFHFINSSKPLGFGYETSSRFDKHGNVNQNEHFNILDPAYLSQDYFCYDMTNLTYPCKLAFTISKYNVHHV